MRISDWSSDVCSSDLLADVEGVQILACGTSFYSGSVARYWIEAITGLPCNVEIASEYRYRSAVANPKHLVVTISQSGETLDTVEALKYAKSLGHDKTLSICNVPESAIPSASNLVLSPRAGPEIGVARSEERRSGKEGVSQLKSSVAPD